MSRAALQIAAYRFEFAAEPEERPAAAGTCRGSGLREIPSPPGSLRTVSQGKGKRRQCQPEDREGPPQRPFASGGISGRGFRGRPFPSRTDDRSADRSAEEIPAAPEETLSGNAAQGGAEAEERQSVYFRDDHHAVLGILERLFQLGGSSGLPEQESRHRIVGSLGSLRCPGIETALHHTGTELDLHDDCRPPESSAVHDETLSDAVLGEPAGALSGDAAERNLPVVSRRYRNGGR